MSVVKAAWETKMFWHSPEMGSVLYSLYKIPLAQACFPLSHPTKFSLSLASGWALVSQPVKVTVSGKIMIFGMSGSRCEGITVAMSSSTIYHQICVLNPKFLMFLVSSCSCLCPIHWSQVLSQEWKCSWSSADRRCSNYIWVINKFIAHLSSLVQNQIW